MAKPTTVEEYIAGVPEGRMASFQELRATINAAAANANATEVIAYDMPALRLDGRFLVSYAAFKTHFSLFPASQMVIDAVGDELAGYLTGKATIRFPAAEPIPLDLVQRVVELRVQELRAR